MLKIMQKIEWRRQVLVLGLCLMSFVCHGDDFKFTRTCLILVGSSALASGDENSIAKHDIAILNRCVWNDIGGNSWGIIKSINPGIELYLYQVGSIVCDYSDSMTIERVNNVARWNNRRISDGGPGTAVNLDHPEFFLLDSSNNRINSTGSTVNWWLDFGLTEYQNYFLDCTINDIVEQSWVADGIFQDNCLVLFQQAFSSPAVKYSNQASWLVAMTDYINNTSAGLHAAGQKTFCNLGVDVSSSTNGYNALIAIDGIANPPDIVLDESTFVVQWRDSAHVVYFFSEACWRRNVDALRAVHNYKIVYNTHCNLDLIPGGIGTDNYGKSVGYYDVFWYALCSYYLGKNEVDDSSYFAFSKSIPGGYGLFPWFDEYDTNKLNLGQAIGQYQIKTISGSNIYMREFVRGYVYVNPSVNDVTSVGLRETCKQLTHDNFQNDPSTIANVNSISLPSHRSAILMKCATGVTDGTVYENAENGDTAGWSVYDNTMPGTITNVYDAARNGEGQVIKLTGGGTQTGYKKLTDAGANWNNSTQFAIEWKMKYSEAFFAIYIQLSTSAGLKYLTYYAGGATEGGTGTYVNYNLPGMTDGKWHTVNRDIKADLAKYQPSVTINAVNAFLIRGSGCIDDIILRPSTTYEDAENGDTLGWSVYDATGTIENVDDPVCGGKVIKLTGNGVNTGFKKLTDASAYWNNASQFMLEWNMKISGGYDLYVLIGTSAGDKYLQYKSTGNDTLGTGQYIVHGLGSGSTDGQWHNFTRNLKADLNEAQPGVTLNSVKAFLIRTYAAAPTVYLDNIKLR